MPLAEFLDNIVMKEYKKPRIDLRGFVFYMVKYAIYINQSVSRD